jgi:hypothetical protein
MSVSRISREWRRIVEDRAGHICEYCLIHEDDTFFGCEVDHIISEKHGGATTLENLAYACMLCNRAKGSDIGSVEPASANGAYHRFYHPRREQWWEHFVLDEFDGITILPRTDIGTVTQRILRLNAEGRLQEREALRLAGRYPSEAARGRMKRPET